MSGAHTRLDESELRRSFERDGLVSIPGFFDIHEIGAVRADLQQFVEAVVPRMPAEQVYRDVVDDSATLKQLQHLEAYDDAFHRLLEAGPFARLAALLCDDDIAPQNLQYFDKAPGTNQATPPHQDGAYFPIKPMNAVTIWLALEDVGHEQGCVRYVRGTHREGLRPHRRSRTLGFSREVVGFPNATDLAREVAFPCAAGHVIAHHALTVHRAERNASSDRHRRALGFIYYAASCVIDERAHADYQAQLADELRSEGRIPEAGP